VPPKSTATTLLATNLDTTLKQQGRSRAWLGRQLALSRPHVSRICTGQRRIHVSDARNASLLLGVPMQLLFESAPQTDAS
jgi:hypothetical protein